MYEFGYQMPPKDIAWKFYSQTLNCQNMDSAYEKTVIIYVFD